MVIRTSRGMAVTAKRELQKFHVQTRFLILNNFCSILSSAGFAVTRESGLASTAIRATGILLTCSWHCRDRWVEKKCTRQRLNKWKHHKKTDKGFKIFTEERRKVIRQSIITTGE